MDSADITKDDQWVVASGRLKGSSFGIAILLKYIPQVNLFQRQTLMVKNNLINSVEISDDHHWVVMGLDDGTVEIYLNDEGENFQLNQTLSPNNNSIVSLSLTNDHQYLAIGYDGHEVLIYHYVNNQFSPFQTLHFNSSTRRKVQLSPDHQHLLVAHADGLVEVYEFGNHSFELALSWGEWLSGETVRDAEMDAEQKLVGVATDQDTYILSMEGTLHELQTLNHSSHQLEFSRDGQHLLTTAEGRLSIFWNQLFQQCHLSYCLQCRNQSCVRCNELVDYFLDPLTGQCELCSIDFCVECSNLTHCSQCDGQFEGVLNQTSGKCEECPINSFFNSTLGIC